MSRPAAPAGALTREAVLQAGDRVRIRTNEHLARCVWWPKGQATGTIQRLFKNGKIAVAVDQVWNTSADHKATMHFKPSDLTLISPAECGQQVGA